MTDLTKVEFTDKHGDVWRLGEDGLMHTSETAPFEFDYVNRKWGPLKVTKTETSNYSLRYAEPPYSMEGIDELDEIDSFNEGLFLISSVYNLPFTNNMPRWQNGEYLHEIGDFISDIHKLVEKFYGKESNNGIS